MPNKRASFLGRQEALSRLHERIDSAVAKRAGSAPAPAPEAEPTAAEDEDSFLKRLAKAEKRDTTTAAPARRAGGCAVIRPGPSGAHAENAMPPEHQSAPPLVLGRALDPLEAEPARPILRRTSLRGSQLLFRRRSSASAVPPTAPHERRRSSVMVSALLAARSRVCFYAASSGGASDESSETKDDAKDPASRKNKKSRRHRTRPRDADG